MSEVRQSDITRAMALTVTWADLSIDDVAAILAAHRQQAEDAMKERAARACEAEQKVFASSKYATGQPLSSFKERFACGRCAAAIRGIDAGGEGEA